MDYWLECIKEAFEDAKIIATEEQIGNVAGWAESGHENYSMAHGHDCIPNPLETENTDLKRKLKKEQGKTICPECKGKGSFMTYGGTFQSSSRCMNCDGTGFIY